jgi:hypothetical protein
MEYKLASADDSAYTTCGNGETTNLVPGSYYVRYAAKPGYSASAAVEVIVPGYQAPVVVAEIDKVEAENGKVTITLKEKPTTAPTAQDFSATIAISEGQAQVLTLDDFNYDGNVTVTFTFAKVEAIDKDQEVVVAVTLGDGDAVAADAFTVETEEIDTEAAKREFLDAVTAHNPESDIYEYSFDGKDLVITFDFTEYKGEDGTVDFMGVANAVMEGAGQFLTAIFDIGKAQQIVIDMNNQDITIDHNSGMDEIIQLAGAVFDVDVSSDFGALAEPVMNFLGMGPQPNLEVTADFTMTVTNQEEVTFILDNLTVTFTNVTEDAQ